MIAEAIVAAVKEINVDVPVVVRLEGNNAELGAKILNESGLKLTSADGLNDAAEKNCRSRKRLKEKRMSVLINKRHQSIGSRFHR